MILTLDREGKRKIDRKYFSNVCILGQLLTLVLDITSAILTTLLCSILLVSSELITELGVHSRKDCGPATKIGPVITKEPVDNVTDAELAASAMRLRGTQFIDKSTFSFVPIGFPRKFTINTCISCFTEDEPNYILKNCKISKESKLYPRGDLFVNVSQTEEAFGTVTHSFSTKNGRERYEGTGDLTRNDEYCVMFIFNSVKHEKGLLRLRYFETVGSNTYCGGLINKASLKKKRNGLTQREDPGILEQTNSSVLSYGIECESSGSLSQEWFEKSLRAYRSMQLEDTSLPVGLTNNHSQNITEDDIYRAVLSTKIIHNIEPNNGSYQEYYECGEYNPTYLAPFLIILFTVIALGLWSVFLLRRIGKLAIPYTSDSWFKLLHDSNKRAGTNRQNALQTYFKPETDEFILDGEEVYIGGHNRSREPHAGFNNIGAGRGPMRSTDGISQNSMWSTQLSPPGDPLLDYLPDMENITPPSPIPRRGTFCK